jgi:hypothetical protein
MRRVKLPARDGKRRVARRPRVVSGIGLAVFGSPRLIQLVASADKINMINAHVLKWTVTYTRVTRWPSFSACSGGLPRAVRKRSVLCGGARAQGSPRPAWSGVWPVISITTHTSTLKQPSPPPSPSPMADTPRTVPAVLPRSPRARTTARALHSVIHGAFVHFQCFHARASIPITLTCFIVLLCRCISFRSSLHSFIPLASTCSCFQCFHMLVLAYPSHSRVSLYCCVVVSYSARLSIPSFLLLPHARASSASTCS